MSWGVESIKVVPCQYNSQGLKVLDVHLGTAGSVRKNWQDVLASITRRLACWKWLLPQMSYRGRVLIINNLVASTLWHRLAVLNAPAGLLADVQRKLVDFFWSGQHWLKASLPMHEGGQGLIDLESRVAALRLKAVQRQLYRLDLPWRATAHALLRKAGNMGLDQHVFLLDTTGLDLSGLESFYALMLSAWTLLQHIRVGGLQPTAWVWEEPIFHNKLIPLRSVLSTALRRRFLNAGLCKVGCLWMADGTGWKTAGLLSQQTGIATQRLLGRLLSEVQQALPQPQHLFMDCSRLNALFGLLHRIWLRLGTTFTFGLFILGLRYTFDRRFRCCLINSVFGQAKLAIWLTRRNRIRGHGLTEPPLLLKSLISARVKLDFAYFSSVTDLMTY
ncbi:hypothetical protein NFI96_008163, partial [Prochilodus magdalenae]